MTRRYKAFISYSWADKAWGEWAHRSLETYRPPKGVADGQSLHPIFKDREEEAAGGSVGAAIEEALAASEFLIVICSPRSAKSQWVNREVAWFKTQKDKRRVLALIVDGEPGHATEECFPRTLTHKVSADLQPTEEWEDAPLAADARPQGDGKRSAKLKLAAALLGVGLDALVRRDDRRRTIRRRWVTGAAFGSAGVLAGLSMFAFNQRDAAVLARNEAVKARDDAEGIIELILTDLKADLEGFGTLKSVTQIGNRAIDYYEGQDIKALTPDQLGRRARVLLMLGEADNKRGDLTAALARYETAAATTQEQLTRDPEKPQRMFDHAQSVFWVGYIAWQRGDRTKAKAQFTEYHDLAQKLVASDPANEDWQAELDYAYSNLGTLAMDDGDSEAAESYFRKSLKLALARLERAPDDVERIYSAGQAAAWLADSLARQRKFKDALAARLDEAALYLSSESAAQHSSIIQSHSVVGQRVAQLYLALGDLPSAQNHAEGALSRIIFLRNRDQDDVKIALFEVDARITLAQIRLHLGDLKQSRNLLGPALELARIHSSSADASSQWKDLVMPRAKLTLARILHAEGRHEDASPVYREIAEAMSQSAVAANAQPRLIFLYCSALAGLANSVGGDNMLWPEIIARLTSTAQSGDPETQTLLMIAYMHTGQTREASELAAGLSNAGYQHPDFRSALQAQIEAAPITR